MHGYTTHGTACTSTQAARRPAAHAPQRARARPKTPLRSYHVSRPPVSLAADCVCCTRARARGGGSPGVGSASAPAPRAGRRVCITHSRRARTRILIGRRRAAYIYIHVPAGTIYTDGARGGGWPAGTDGRRTFAAAGSTRAIEGRPAGRYGGHARQD